MAKRMVIKISPKEFTGFLFLIFFCNEPITAVLGKVCGERVSNYFYCLIFFVILLFAILSKKEKTSLSVPFFVYFVVFLLFFLTWLVHPEYKEWFLHSFYGIVPAIISPKSGIWAFLIIWLIQDSDDLYTYMMIAAWVLFVFYGLHFIVATARGYWIVKEIDGTVRYDSYSMEFGYSILLPVVFFGGCSFLSSKNKYFIPYAIGTIMIFTFGSRGAAIWAVAIFIMVMPFKWNNIKKSKRICVWFLLIVFSIVIVLIGRNYKTILERIISLLSRYGISSRTLTSLLSGSFTDGNGRERIYGIAIDLIKKGGLFGYGVYGDRYVIGNYFKWGYSHNIFLEMFVSFGYLGGGIACGILLFGIVKLYKSCDTIKQQILFITFLATSCQLILSHSFWYINAFWGLLALMMKWNKKNKDRYKEKQWINNEKVIRELKFE